VESFVQYLINGLAVGGVYALVAIGYVVVFRVVRIVNIAQGDFLAAATLVFLWLMNANAGLPLAIAGAIVAALAASLFVERVAVTTGGWFDELRAFLLTLAASQLIQGALLLLFGTQYLTMPAGAPPIITLGGLHINGIYLLVIALVAVALVGMVFFLERTPLGWAMLATADDPLAARLCAVPVRSMGVLAFAIAALVAGVGGAAYGAVAIGSWNAGTTLSTAGFAAAVLGGMKNPTRAAVGGFLLGVLQALVSGYAASYLQDPLTFVFLIVVLLAPATRRAIANRRRPQRAPTTVSVTA
jgi:branched-chain amino acid transport system permease protein